MSKAASVNNPIVSPNRIAAPGSFSASHDSQSLREQKKITSFQLRNQMFNQKIKNELTMLKNSKKQANSTQNVDVPKQGLTSSALKKHNRNGSVSRPERRNSGEILSTSRSSTSDSSRKKSAYELEIILVEKQLQLKRMQAEQEKVRIPIILYFKYYCTYIIEKETLRNSCKAISGETNRKYKGRAVYS